MCNASLLVLEDNIPAHEATNHMTTNTKTSAEARPRHGVTWAWSREEARRRHEASTTDPVLEPAQTFDDQYSTFFEFAAIRPDADAARTGAHSQTIRGLLCGTCAGWRTRPTSVELHNAMRADNPTNRQQSIAAVLINEASLRTSSTHISKAPSRGGSSRAQPTGKATSRRTESARSTPSAPRTENRWRT